MQTLETPDGAKVAGVDAPDFGLSPRAPALVEHINRVGKPLWVQPDKLLGVCMTA